MLLKSMPPIVATWTVPVLFTAIALGVDISRSEKDQGTAKKDKNETSAADPQRWAFLIAGSKGWENYDDQANVCHAYKLLKSHGIKEDNMVVMMYDDIADNIKNLNSGVIINEPNGTNVYEGVKIDYKKSEVNPRIFISVLKGNTTAVKGKGSGRVIQSGRNDTIFVYFSGKGVPGALNFPRHLLYAEKLNNVLKGMVKRRKFAKMVLYIDAPYSGSLFENLLSKDDNILAVTAAAPWQTAYKCYKDKKLGVSLGSYFSVNWMHDTEARTNLTTSFLRYQISYVIRRTSVSSISKYGDFRLEEMPLSDLMGTKPVPRKPFEPCETYADVFTSKKARLPRALREYTAFAKQNETHKKEDAMIANILRLVAMGEPPLIRQFSMKEYKLQEENVKCYEDSVRYFDKKCVNIAENPHIGRDLHKFINMCSSKKTDIAHVRRAIDEVCRRTG